MAVALVPLAMALAPWIRGAVWERVLGMAALVAAGMFVYGGLCLLFKAADLGELRQMLKRRRGGKKEEKGALPPPSFD
jgi:hypothetical protein